MLRLESRLKHSDLHDSMDVLISSSPLTVLPSKAGIWSKPVIFVLSMGAGGAYLLLLTTLVREDGSHQTFLHINFVTS